jgi:RND family efflux transporter MFP subunit
MDRDEREAEPSASREGRRRRLGGWALRGLLGVGLVLLGVAGGIVWSERRAAVSGSARGGSDASGGAAQGGTAMPAMPGMPAGEHPAAGAAAKDDEPVEVSLTPEAVERAGIKTAAVRSEASVGTMTVPGTVMSNAYRDTKVNALVGGIVRRVGVELGQAVGRGQALAVIFSSELADAQMKYLSMQASFVADHQKLDRTEKLAAIGAASQQELEEITAVHHAHETEVAAARQRLLLLGLTSEQVGAIQDASHVVSEVAVTAPSEGLVIARNVNPGQVVAAGQDLFLVTDLSTVWIIGDLYEKDFGSVRVGSEATVTVPAAPRDALRGRVTYIDPRVDPATRTAKVRVEVPNRKGDLRLGMYVSVSFQTGAGEQRTLVPKSAVQMLGERAVVYVPAPDDQHRFVERSVRLGPAVGELVQVLEGVKPGERVVTEGSFLLRAEAARTRSGG